MSDIPTLLERLARLQQNESHAHGLKPVQWEALRYLARANRFSRTPGAVTAYLGTTKGTVSQTLTALERKGLIRKTQDAGDRRSVHLEMTEAGMTLLESDPAAGLSASLDGLNGDVRAGLDTGLKQLLQETLAANGNRPFGLCRACRHFQRDTSEDLPFRCGLLNVALSEADATLICVEQEPAGA